MVRLSPSTHGQPAFSPAVDHADLLDRAPADVADVQQARARVDAEAERVPEAVRVDHAPHRRRLVGVVERVRADASAVGRDVEDLAVRVVEVLRAQRLGVAVVAGVVTHAPEEAAVGRHDHGVGPVGRAGLGQVLGEVGAVHHGLRPGEAGRRAGRQGRPLLEHAVPGPADLALVVAEVDVAGGAEVPGQGEAEQPVVVHRPDPGDLADLAGLAAVRDEGDRAVLAQRQQAAVGEPGEVREVVLVLAGVVADQREPVRQLGCCAGRCGRQDRGGGEGESGQDDEQTTEHGHRNSLRRTEARDGRKARSYPRASRVPVQLR